MKILLSSASTRPVRRLSLLVAVVLLAFLAGGPARAQQDTSNFSSFQNSPVNSVLDVYEQLSGLHLIRDVALAGVPPISINATGLDRAATLRMIESALLLNGIAIVPLDAKTAKVVAVSAAKNPRSEGVHLYANAADLPAQDQVVSYYMSLNFISPDEAKAIFDQQAPVHSYGSYVPAPSAQAVILTEDTSVLRQLIALKELIDVPPAQVKTEFIQLHRADAEKVADILTSLIQAKGQPGLGQGLQRPGGQEESLISGNAEIVPDPRSNRLLIATRPTNMALLTQLAAELDQPDDFIVPQTRPLKYVLADDILPALEAALAQGKDELTEIKAPTASTNAQGTPAQQQQTQSSSNGTGSNNGATIAAITSPLTAPAENNAPSVATIGKTRLLADNRSNSIIVFGTPDAVERVFEVIDELDKKPLQVYLATVIGQLTVAEGEEFGIDILQKFQHIGSLGLAGSNLNTANGLASTSTASSVPEPSSLLSSTGFPVFSGLTLYGAIGSTLDAYVRALETTNRFKIVSRPSVYTTNNRLAVIASGSEVPIPGTTVSGFTGSTDTNNLVSSSSIQYQQVLLQLDIIPLINADKQVTLKIRQTNNSLGVNTLISGNEIPSINTQEINTEVTVPDKSTIVIGGLISDTNKRTTGGVPWLSDIPVLGYLFKDTVKSKERDELIIMIQPTVVANDADQIAVNEAEKQRTILGKEAEAAAGPTTIVTTTDKVTETTGKNSLPVRTDTQSTTVRTESAAPNVVNGGLPKYPPPPPSATTP
jgi:general secretion pathway protein D